MVAHMRKIKTDKLFLLFTPFEVAADYRPATRTVTYVMPDLLAWLPLAAKLLATAAIVVGASVIVARASARSPERWSRPCRSRSGRPMCLSALDHDAAISPMRR